MSGAHGHYEPLPRCAVGACRSPRFVQAAWASAVHGARERCAPGCARCSGRFFSLQRHQAVQEGRLLGIGS